jgi:hypothetical protein
MFERSNDQVFGSQYAWSSIGLKRATISFSAISAEAITFFDTLTH